MTCCRFLSVWLVGWTTLWRADSSILLSWWSTYAFPCYLRTSSFRELRKNHCSKPVLSVSSYTQEPIFTLLSYTSKCTRVNKKEKNILISHAMEPLTSLRLFTLLFSHASLSLCASCYTWFQGLQWCKERSIVKKWCTKFDRRLMNVHNQKLSARLSVVTQWTQSKGWSENSSR